MAENRKWIGTLAAIGAAAAAATVVYYKRDQIRDLVNDINRRFHSEKEDWIEDTDDGDDGEGNIVIDITGGIAQPHEEEGNGEV